jgi:hypothetical protein
MLQVDYFVHAGSGHPDGFRQTVKNKTRFFTEQSQYKKRGLMCQPAAAGCHVKPSVILPAAVTRNRERIIDRLKFLTGNPARGGLQSRHGVTG